MQKEVRYIRVSKKHPCPICAKPDNCKIADDGSTAYCRRIETGSVKKGRDGGVLHILIRDADFSPKIKITPKPEDTSPRSVRSAEELNQIYSEFLSQCVLSHAHEADLKRRGLGLTDIHLHGYKSMPSPLYASAICAQMAKYDDLSGVPGFYQKNAAWHFIDYRKATGYLIPIRNARLDIVALQLRRETIQTPKYLIISSAGYRSGASPGVPPHFAILGICGRSSAVESVIVTEGALKANIIAKFTGKPTVGLVGVGCFADDFGDVLRAAYPNLRAVQIAFDMDAATNKQVKAQRDRLVLTLKNNQLETTILSWNPLYKGLDDFLSAKNTQLQAA